MLIAVGSIGVLAAVAVIYLVRAAGGPSEETSASSPSSAVSGSGASTPDPAASWGAAATSTAAPKGFVLDGKDDLLFVDSTPGPHYGRLAITSASNPSAPLRTSDLVCARVYAAGGHVLCLRPTGNLAPAYQAVIMDYSFKELRTVDVAGVPSRARLSADGNIASWTVFVSGDSYLTVGFATRTSILDLRSGVHIPNLETFSVLKDGKPYKSVDINFWGVTITKDDRHFYATMSSKGTTYLVRGDVGTKQVTTLRTNLECPSLSPDNTRLVFKKRVDAEGGRRPWRLYVLDLATMQETPLAETQSVDDQAAWLDNDTVAYSLPVQGIASYDVWKVRADGAGAPQKVLTGAASPALLRAS